MSELRLYNTLTRKKDRFAPLDPTAVRMYVCGPTVYDQAHIGNARPAIVFDLLFRLLRHLYGSDHVTYVRNITDIDDKIIAKARERFPGRPLNEAIREITETTYAQYRLDVAALGCLAPTHEPRATETIPEMLAMIGILLTKHHAYVAEGHVLFDVKSWREGGALEYGKLSNRSLDDMLAGARVEVAPYKRDPMDFVLWKPSTTEEPGWDSPWGRGRPGWHIECSAMAGKYLGATFDIHGGGIDLSFPHHENELAQSRCAHGTKIMAQVWMHNGFLQVESEKMSKSLGNFVTIHELLEKWPGEVLRFNMLRTQYRQPIDWTEAGLRESESVLNDWYELASDAEPGMLCADEVDALLDDLNTPRALAALHEVRAEAAKGATGAKRSLKASANLLGLMQMTSAEWTQSRRATVLVETGDINRHISARLSALAARNFAEADRIRDTLAAQGVQLMDYKDPETGERRTKWEVRR
ncbi:MAG: cysteine--tRNA ligase [Cucumibacter sp.]